MIIKSRTCTTIALIRSPFSAQNAFSVWLPGSAVPGGGA